MKALETHQTHYLEESRVCPRCKEWTSIASDCCGSFQELLAEHEDEEAYAETKTKQDGV